MSKKNSRPRQSSLPKQVRPPLPPPPSEPAPTKLVQTEPVTAERAKECLQVLYSAAQHAPGEGPNFALWHARNTQAAGSLLRHIEAMEKLAASTGPEAPEEMEQPQPSSESQ
jgi:hypothetical protein